jgi:4-aminobutyrate aminotransferase-like enzyme
MRRAEVGLMSGLSAAEILDRRGRFLSRALSLHYDEPLHIVRGQGQYLYDAGDRRYLDCINNVAHVGHCHPKVVDAAARQSALLNTNTRFLHENVVRYAERLAATFPQRLEVCFFVCSGSEANELALRLARTHTGRSGVVVHEGAYHGNTSSLTEVSPYKFDGPGGSGRPPHVHVASAPDPYRGRFRADDPEAGAKYADFVSAAVRYARDAGSPAAAFLAEPLLGAGGHVVPPPGYLAFAFEHARAAGAVCIADEVQTGFGRVGSHFWAVETQDAVPDVVSMGKPIGNGHPLAAVITTREIARSFEHGPEYFNTFGGNPVSSAVGLAVLDVIAEEGLQRRALEVGRRLRDGLRELATRHEAIGDVRGLGLFLGVELVRDRETREPAAELARRVVNRCRDEGVLLNTEGPLGNVIKIKPPLVFSEGDADQLCETMGGALRREGSRRLPGAEAGVR